MNNFLVPALRNISYYTINNLKFLITLKFWIEYAVWLSRLGAGLPTLSGPTYHELACLTPIRLLFMERPMSKLDVPSRITLVQDVYLYTITISKMHNYILL